MTKDSPLTEDKLREPEDHLHDCVDESDGMCECGRQTWEMCDCGKFFLEYVCGYDPRTRQCSMAGTEDCDWECPRRV